MKEAIRERARELGFDACRFTTAKPPDGAGHLQPWLEYGSHGEMAYIQRNAHKRVDPQQVLEGARSILCLAASYHEDANERTLNPPAVAPKGVVARYARFADYHEVIGGRLKELSSFIDSLGGNETRSLWYVDTGPLLERDLAQRAGVGFIGKHTNLISRSLGNWFFLGEILTTVTFEPDAPERNHCGSCARCISACPTQAIRAPFQLDARRCISYLTIELKGSIPVKMRPSIGRRIYGCDDCLEACPWNRFATAGRMMAPHARRELSEPDLIELLRLTDAGFKERFRGTPLMRTKRRGLLRNVCVALGNVGDSRALPALEHAAQDTEPLIAEHARWAIDQILKRSVPVNDNGRTAA